LLARDDWRKTVAGPKLAHQIEEMRPMRREGWDKVMVKGVRLVAIAGL
jgi:hypothetical protein